MRKITILILLLLPMLVTAQKKYSLSGTLKDFQLQKIFLSYSTGEINKPNVRDSAHVSNGKYHFSGTISTATFAILQGGDNSLGSVVITLAPEQYNITHTGSLANIEITGSRTQAAFEKLNALEKAYALQFSTLKEEGQIKALEHKKNEHIYGNFIRNNPTSPLALYALKRYAGNVQNINVEKVGPLFRLLPVHVRNSMDGQQLSKIIEYKKTFKTKNFIGGTAQLFSLPDTIGRKISLSSYKGRYVLVDFWASWCAPCRADNPLLKSAYLKFKSQGFDILSISIDRAEAKDKWMKAIRDDGLNQWSHVADLEDPGSSVVKKYGVLGIPQNFLIDPNGKIVGIGLRGTELDEALSKIFSK